MIPNLTIPEACELALKHRLYVTGWMLKGNLERGLQHPCYIGLQQAAIFLDGTTPVAVAVVTHYGDIQVFVRLSHRREGIGRKLVNHMRELMGEQAKHMDAGYGIAGSREFWSAVGIKMWD